MAYQSVGERKALLSRLYKKFPHLFQKIPNAQKPKIFSLKISATREKVEEAFQILKSRGDHSDLDGFKKVFSLYCDGNDNGETATKSDAAFTPPIVVPPRISDDFKDVTVVKHNATARNSDCFEYVISEDNANAEEIATEPYTAVGSIFSDDKDAVTFYFGDDYGNRREFAELEKEVISGYASHLTVRSRAFKRCKLSLLEEMLKEFAMENLF